MSEERLSALKLMTFAGPAIPIAALGLPLTVFIPQFFAGPMGLGFAHAQDRLWQMEVLRMAGQGRLSELFGEATIPSDTFLRTLDMAGVSRDSFELLKPETKKVIEAYVAGINAYINRETGKFSTKFPPEFLILGVKPEPWQAWQSGLVVKVMALTLDQNMGHEIKRLAMASKGFSPREIESLVGYGPRDNPAPLPDLRKIYQFPAKSASNPPAKYADIVVETGKRASNNWVISGSRITSVLAACRIGVSATLAGGS